MGGTGEQWCRSAREFWRSFVRAYAGKALATKVVCRLHKPVPSMLQSVPICGVLLRCRRACHMSTYTVSTYSACCSLEAAWTSLFAFVLITTVWQWDEAECLPCIDLYPWQCKDDRAHNLANYNYSSPFYYLVHVWRPTTTVIAQSNNNQLTCKQGTSTATTHVTKYAF